MLFTDVKFLRQIGYRLERFKEKKTNELWNCRCPICGDSSHKSNKTRGYFYVKQGTMLYMCHNCQASMSFGNFLKDFDPNLYNQYALEKFGDKTATKKAPQVPSFQVDTSKYATNHNTNVFDQLTSIEDLDAGHPARLYVQERMIPEKFWSTLKYAPKYIHWAAKHTDKFHVEKGTKDHPRLIIPWFNFQGEPTGYSARSFGRPDPKYYTIPLAEEKGFCGLDRLDLDKRIYVLEGAIDSLFLPNSVAVSTSALWKFESDGLDVVYIPDRDIRNKEIMKIVKKMVDDGKQVCMLPDDLPGKDLNDFVKNGLSSAEIADIINHNVYQGLSAQMHFTKWSKI